MKTTILITATLLFIFTFTSCRKPELAIVHHVLQFNDTLTLSNIDTTYSIDTIYSSSKEYSVKGEWRYLTDDSYTSHPGERIYGEYAFSDNSLIITQYTENNVQVGEKYFFSVDYLSEGRIKATSLDSSYWFEILYYHKNNGQSLIMELTGIDGSPEITTFKL